MYCNDVGGWVWWADATESYVQGSQTGKWCKLKVQNFYCCWVLLEYTVHKVSYIRSKFPHFSISSNINSQQNAVRMYPSCDVTFISVLMNYFVLYVKRSIA